MEEQKPAVVSEDSGRSLPRSFSTVSLTQRRDSKRRSLNSNFMISAAQTALVSSSRVVTRRTVASVKRTTESVALTKSLIATKKCKECNRQFKAEVGKRRHCRKCGYIFCYECCSDKVHLSVYHSRWGVLKNNTTKTQFVCKQCAEEVRSTIPEPPSAPRQRTYTEDEIRNMEMAEGGGSRPRRGSVVTRVRKTRARTLDRYMEAVRTIRSPDADDQAGQSTSSPPSIPPTEPAIPDGKQQHRRQNTLDDGFKYRLKAKQEQQRPMKASLHRAKELRDIFFNGVTQAEADRPKSQSVSSQRAASSVDERSKLPQQALTPGEPQQQPLQSWGSFFSSIIGAAVAVGKYSSSTLTSNSSRIQQDIDFDNAFEEEEMVLEEALAMSQEQLRKYEQYLKESEKQLQKSRMEQVKRMTLKLLELQERKIRDAVQKGAVIEKQMQTHAKNLEAHIRSGHYFDDSKEGDVVDLRDELRSVYLHLDELSVETVFPQCMRWKLRSKVEEGLFVGVRDMDIEKLDCNFTLKSSGLMNRVVLHMDQIHASVALYEFVIRGSSAKAKVLSRALAPTLNKVELHATGEIYLPLIFEQGGSQGQAASRWVPDKEKASYKMVIAKTAENTSVLHLPDSFLQWLVNSLIPSLVEYYFISALPTRDMGTFLCESKNESVIRGKLRIHGDITPRIWKAPLVGPTHASIAARRALGVTEDEAAILDYLLRSQLATTAGFQANKAVTLSILHTWRLTYAAHSLAALAPMIAIVEKGSHLKIPSNWTLQLLRRVDELAAKPMTIQFQLFDIELDLDVKEMLTAITGLYLNSVEANVAKELELEAAREAKRNRRGSDQFFANGDQNAPNPEDALRLARETVSQLHKTFDRTLIPLLRDQVRTNFNAMLAGGSGGMLAFSFTEFVADICLPSRFQFSKLMWQSPEIYEGFVLKMNGKEGPGDGEYTMRFNVLPVGEECSDDEGGSYDNASQVENDEEDDAEMTLKNMKMELFPVGRVPGAIHLSCDAWRSSFLLNSLIKGFLASATPQLDPAAIEEELRHEALHEERKVRRASMVQTEQTRDLLIQSRQVVENLWGSFRLMPGVTEQDQIRRDVIEIAGGLDPLSMHFENHVTSSSLDDDQYTEKILLPYLTNDAFALHIDIRGLELALRKVKSSNGVKGESIRLVVVKHLRHERDSLCASFSMRRNLQDVLQADLLPI